MIAIERAFERSDTISFGIHPEDLRIVKSKYFLKLNLCSVMISHTCCRIEIPISKTLDKVLCICLTLPIVSFMSGQ